MTEKWATEQSCIHNEITSCKVPSLVIHYVMPCPFTLQVPKCFRLVQIFCARSKSYLHFWRGTKCSPIFGLAQKIWTGTKRFGTCNRTRQKRVCLTYISTVVWLALGLYKMGLRVPQRPETQAAGPTWSSLLILRRIQECYSRNCV